VSIQCPYMGILLWSNDIDKTKFVTIYKWDKLQTRFDLSRPYMGILLWSNDIDKTKFVTIYKWDKLQTRFDLSCS
jgi:uncharacterized protein (DUF2132 family)